MLSIRAIMLTCDGICSATQVILLYRTANVVSGMPVYVRLLNLYPLHDIIAMHSVPASYPSDRLVYWVALFIAATK